MFGYLTASAQVLTEEEQNRYRACYCGLCRSLKLRHGQLSRLTLNYDMTFLVLLLESLYEPEEESGSGACIAHPREKRAWWRSEITDYAADMNVARAYLNLMDDWKDDANLPALAEAAALKKAYREVCRLYPRQCEAMEASIRSLAELEKAHIEDADAAAAAFGSLLGSIFVCREDRWAEPLYHLGDALGRFIYLLDACMDLEKDTAHGSYNPFRRYYGLENEARFRSILKLFLADAVRAFGYLPLVEDAGLLKNILCLGLWTAFDDKYRKLGEKKEKKQIRKEEGKGDGTGSV